MCDTLVVVKRGRVLFAKNSDRDGNEAQVLDWQPRRSHAPGDRVACTWIEIPQVPQTHAVLLSRPFWMWGAEMGTNEHGVTIGNEAVFTRQRKASTGLTGMDLLRLALERAETARAAVDVITALLEKHGQGGGCGHENRKFTYHNSFIVADAHGAFVLETAASLWRVEEVTGARSISNGLTIDGFAQAQRDPLMDWAAACRDRQPRTQQLAQQASGVADMMRILRDHGDGRRHPHYSAFNGGLAAPCVHAGGLVANSQSTASWVAELTPGATSHWVTATSAPCTGLFKPVRVDSPLQLPGASDVDDGKSPWWRHEDLHRRVARNPERLMPLFATQRDEVETAWIAAPPSSADAFARSGELLTGWLEAVQGAQVPDGRPWYARRYWDVRSARAHLR